MKDRDPDWASPVISFLSSNLPRLLDHGWDHMFSSPHQLACEALVAFGEAAETSRGAIPLDLPERPEHLPRWDDICIAVLRLAEAQGKLQYSLPDGTSPPSRSQWQAVGAPPPPPPNIRAAQGLGPARAEGEAADVLNALGLVGAEGRWTEQAELVLWRDQPREWDMDVTSDPRFLDATRIAVDEMPPDRRLGIDRLVRISEADVEDHIRSHDDAIDEARKKYGPKALLGVPMTPDTALEFLSFLRRNELDWVFFRHWRLREGWLTRDQAASALEVFHDPLASDMRRAVLLRLYPDLPQFAK